MSLIVEGVLEGDIVLEETMAAFPDATIEAEYQATPEMAILLVDVSDPEAFEAQLRADPTVEDVDRIADTGSRRIYGVGIALDREMLVARVGDFGVQVLEVAATDRGWWLRLRAQDRTVLGRIQSLADELGLTFRTEGIYTESGEAPSTPLTSGQEEVLLEAYEAGYFAQPREASLDDLADRLDISSSAASGRLRRATEALVETVLKNGT